MCHGNAHMHGRACGSSDHQINTCHLAYPGSLRDRLLHLLHHGAMCKVLCARCQVQMVRSIICHMACAMFHVPCAMCHVPCAVCRVPSAVCRLPCAMYAMCHCQVLCAIPCCAMQCCCSCGGPRFAFEFMCTDQLLYWANVVLSNCCTESAD